MAPCKLMLNNSRYLVKKSDKRVENSGEKEYNKDEDRIKSQFPSGKSKTYYHDDGTSASYPIESVKISQEILKNAEKVEPISTKTLKDVAKRVGAKLEGLESRIKSEESMARKITGYVVDSAFTLEEARKEIRDAVRYTMVSNEESFTQNFFLARKKLEEQGLTFTKVSNTWYEGSSYKGINCNFKDNEGNTVELQFHTQKSLEIKEINHKLYEEQRLLKKGNPMIDKIEIEMAKNSKKITTPKNVENIKL